MLGGVTEYVVVEEGYQSGEGADGEQGKNVQPGFVEDDGVGGAGYCGESRSKSVDAVYKVDGVGDEHYEQYCECHGDCCGHYVYAEESVEVGQLYAAYNQEYCGEHLHHEFGAVLDADQVVSHSDEVEGDNRTGNEAEVCYAVARHTVNCVSKIGASDTEQKQHREEYSGEERYAPRRGTATLCILRSSGASNSCLRNATSSICGINTPVSNTTSRKATESIISHVFIE